MIHLPASVRVYLCLTACDMRKSFDGLHALVREHLELDAFAGHLFVFAAFPERPVAIVQRAYLCFCYVRENLPFPPVVDVII